jgi:hypothetical protein
MKIILQKNALSIINDAFQHLEPKVDFKEPRVNYFLEL